MTELEARRKPMVEVFKSLHGEWIIECWACGLDLNIDTHDSAMLLTHMHLRDFHKIGAGRR